MFKSSINTEPHWESSNFFIDQKVGDRCRNCTLSEHTKQGTKGSLSGGWNGGIFPWSLRNDLDIPGEDKLLKSNADLFHPVTLSEIVHSDFPIESQWISHFCPGKVWTSHCSRGWFHHIPPTYSFQLQKSCTSFFYMVNIPLFF